MIKIILVVHDDYEPPESLNLIRNGHQYKGEVSQSKLQDWFLTLEGQTNEILRDEDIIVYSCSKPHILWAMYK